VTTRMYGLNAIYLDAEPPRLGKTTYQIQDMRGDRRGVPAQQDAAGNWVIWDRYVFGDDMEALRENIGWIHALWSHWWQARQPNNLQPTSFWDCVRCTVALFLNRQDDRLNDMTYDDEGNCTYVDEAIAWGNPGHYDTDYGTGQSWDELVVGPWCTFAVRGNGSL
jgi:hypothetical protein